MRDATRRGMNEGVVFGLMGGILLFASEILVGIVTGQSPLMTLRMVASVALGRDALTTQAVAAVVIIGIVVQLTLSAIYGVVCGLINTWLWDRRRMTVVRQFGIGLAFGALLWLANYQIIARAFYPWLLAKPQLVQAALNAVFFGLPVTLMLDAAERRYHRRPGGKSSSSSVPAHAR